MVSKILIISMIVCTVNAAVWIGALPKKPKDLAHKEGCYIKEINDVVPFGTELKPIGHCYRITCGGSMIDYASCGVVATNDEHCHVTEIDPKKPYPECCPDIKCDSENDINVVS